MELRTSFTVAAVWTLLSLTACSSASKLDPAANDPARPGDTIAATAADQPCVGPRKRVAILRFGGTGKYGAYEGWDVGDAIAAQLATALEATDCFVIADRMVLSEVLREQELGLAGVVADDTASRAGRLIGAQVLIKGEITEFETGKKGSGLNLGFGFSKIPLGLRVGGNRNVAHIAIDLRLIDASTGEILFSETISSEAKNFGLALGVDYDKGSIGTDHFSKTPFGKAVRDAAAESAGYIVQQLRDVDWTGQVITTEGSQIFMNAGANSGVRVGDTFTVTNVAKELVDPASGVVLGRIERRLGQVEVQSVTDLYAVARVMGDFPVRRGDYLRH
ncbi:MAG: CsgG/HfaB family protein [Gammaproteobacteria bacterium]